jgi:hypothetical protein
LLAGKRYTQALPGSGRIWETRLKSVARLQWHTSFSAPYIAAKNGRKRLILLLNKTGIGGALSGRTDQVAIK